MRHRNGGYVALESRGGFIRNSAGEIESLVIVARDIRHRKHAEQAQKLEAIGQLASGIAHEINTPNQFIGDNISFVADSWRQLNQVLALSCCIAKQSKTVGGPTPDCLAQLQTRIDEADLPFGLLRLLSVRFVPHLRDPPDQTLYHSRSPPDLRGDRRPSASRQPACDLVRFAGPSPARPIPPIRLLPVGDPPLPGAYGTKCLPPLSLQEGPSGS